MALIVNLCMLELSNPFQTVMITVTTIYNLEIVATPLPIPESPFVHFKHDYFWLEQIIPIIIIIEAHLYLMSQSNKY